MSLLRELTNALNAGTIRIVDLTQPLGPQTPVIGLPEQFHGSPGVTMETSSRFDAKGSAWYWSVMHMGGHIGAHFDGPVKLVTGKDFPNNATDAIPLSRFVGPASVIDVPALVSK